MYTISLSPSLTPECTPPYCPSSLTPECTPSHCLSSLTAECTPPYCLSSLTPECTPSHCLPHLLLNVHHLSQYVSVAGQQHEKEGTSPDVAREAIR